MLMAQKQVPIGVTSMTAFSPAALPSLSRLPHRFRMLFGGTILLLDAGQGLPIARNPCATWPVRFRWRRW